MNPHQRCLQAKVKYRNEPKQVMPKSEDPSRSLEINAIWTFGTEFPTIFNKSCTYITFKSAVKHRQLGYGLSSVRFWIITPYPYFIIWEVLLAITR